MSERIHVLTQQLLGKPSLASCSLSEVRQLADRFPYFAAAQFLLLEKLKESSSPEYTAQLQKAVLYYHDPISFEYFFNEERFYTDESTFADATADKSTFGEAMADEVFAEAMAEEARTEEPAQVEVPQEQPVMETAPPPAANEPLAFEPYHTVDYFASQGIKLSQEEAGRDKFGKQLKSFTEWLKTMKRLPRQEAVQADARSEQNVQHMAADSVHEADVVTEAMAEVWLKQGNTAKAAEVYRKLSLLNPDKNAYFAAKIDQLKRS